MAVVTSKFKPYLRDTFRLLIAVRESLQIVTSDWLGLIGIALLVLFGLLALGYDQIAPYGAFDINYEASGTIVRLKPPSQAHWLGTDSLGRDVFSQVVLGARMALIVGLLSAIGATLVGVNVGLVAGYYGGRIDQILMRLTDVAYGIPFIPFALIFVSLVGPSLWNIVFVIILFQWRDAARVIRSQVLSLKERPFVLAARATGASHLRTLYVHIAPNILPLVFLYMALLVSTAVLVEAGLSFLGFGDPLRPTWGQMLNAAFTSGAVRRAWWWVLPPGIALSLFVAAVYFVTRAYEQVANPRLQAR